MEKKLSLSLDEVLIAVMDEVESKWYVWHRDSMENLVERMREEGYEFQPIAK